MDIELTNLTTEPLNPRVVIKLAKKAGRLAGLPRKALISIVFVDTEKIQTINKNYRNQDQPTDVLAFLYNPAKARPFKFVTPKFVRATFGEIFLCPEIIRAKSGERGMTKEEYQKLLIAHAMLHLKGLEHGDEGSAEEMERREREIIDEII